MLDGIHQLSPSWWVTRVCISLLFCAVGLERVSHIRLDYFFVISIVVISVFPQNHSGNRNWNNTCVFSSFWPMLSRMGAACWLSTAWAAYATFSEAVQRCHQHTGENFRKRNTLRSSLDFCAKTKQSGRVLGHPAAFTLTRQSKNGHTQYAFSGPNTQLRANYGVRPNYGPITGQLLGFRPNTQLFMLGQ